MQVDICTKPCSGPIISSINTWINGLIFYPTSDIEQYQLMILPGFIGNFKNYRKCIMLSNIISLAFNVCMFSWIRSAREIENVIDITKKGIDIVLICSFPNISLSPLWSIKNTHACHQQDIIYFHVKVIFYLRSNPCI